MEDKVKASSQKGNVLHKGRFSVTSDDMEFQVTFFLCDDSLTFIKEIKHHRTVSVCNIQLEATFDLLVECSGFKAH